MALPKLRSACATRPYHGSRSSPAAGSGVALILRNISLSARPRSRAILWLAAARLAVGLRQALACASPYDVLFQKARRRAVARSHDD